MKSIDIAVIGSGIAGLAAAFALKRDGHRVTLFERFATPLPIGSGLMIQPTGLAVLHALGLRDDVIAAGARIDRLFGLTDRGRTVLDVRYAALGSPAAFGTGIHRAALFDALHRAVIAADVRIETNHEVVSSTLAAGGRRTLTFVRGANAGPFDLVVDALGTASPLIASTGRDLPYGALWASLAWPDGAGFDPAALEQRYVRASRMAGVMPIGRSAGVSQRQAAFFWSLRRDQLEGWRARGLDAWKHDVAELWPATVPLLDQIDSADRLTFARYVHRTHAAPGEPAMIHIGDAWHATSPQLGQGANMALLDVYALAISLRAAPDVASAVTAAVTARRLHVALYQGMSRLFTPVYQSDSALLPWVRDRLVGPVSKHWPATTMLAAIVSGGIGAPLRRLGLTPAAPSPRGVPSTTPRPG